jgi:hypothetical protein
MYHICSQVGSIILRAKGLLCCCVALAALQVLAKALKKATGSGISGASAAVVQVVTLMWLRTVMNLSVQVCVCTAQAMTRN